MGLVPDHPSAVSSPIKWVTWIIGFPSACNSYFTVVYQVCNCIMSKNNISAVQFSHSVVSDAATPGTTARQASLSITNSQSVLQLMPIESVMPSSHLILCRPLLLPPSVFPSVRVFMSLSLQQVIESSASHHLFVSEGLEMLWEVPKTETQSEQMPLEKWHW